MNSNVKEEIIKTINDMPDDSTFDEIIYALYLKAKNTDKPNHE